MKKSITRVFISIIAVCILAFPGVYAEPRTHTAEELNAGSALHALVHGNLLPYFGIFDSFESPEESKLRFERATKRNKEAEQTRVAVAILAISTVILLVALRVVRKRKPQEQRKGSKKE